MRLVDANILIYAYDRNSDHHEMMRFWLDECLNGLPKTGLPWPSLLAFVRIVTNPRIFEKPASISEAWKQVTTWLGARSAWVPLPTERHASILEGIISRVTVSANDIPDIHLVTLCLEHGLKLCSTDAGFARFTEIEWKNPLKS